MTLLYQSDRFLDHDTGGHPENAGRLKAIAERLAQRGLAERCDTVDFASAKPEVLLGVHTAQHLEAMDSLASRGGGQPEADTIVCPMSMRVARLAAGAVTDATRRVVGGETARALCLVRPPGHHALVDGPMGFCLINNAAVAANLAIESLGLDRVLIVDFDVHHGNGTQDIFYRSDRVGFFSMHRWPFYPGTGAADETGAGSGLGATRNLPVEYGTPRKRQLEWFASELGDFADKLKPQLVIVSAGFDSHRSDPVGSLGLETEDYIALTQAVARVADTHSQGRVVSVLEGGYNPIVLADCVAVHLEELLDD